MNEVLDIALTVMIISLAASVVVTCIGLIVFMIRIIMDK